MDLGDETRAAHKRTFLKFFEEKDLVTHIKLQFEDMVNSSRRRFIINLKDFFNNTDGSNMARRLLQNPSEYVQPLCDALTDLFRVQYPKHLKEGDQVLVGFQSPFVSRKVTPRELLSSFIGSMVCVQGIVTKCSLVRPKVVKSVHFCPDTNKFMTRDYRDITSNVGLPTGSVYPTRDESGNLLVTEYGLCTYKDHQTLSIQEVPEKASPGQLPRTVDVIVEEDLVDSCKPGDRVSVVGIYKAVPGKSKGSMNGVFRTILIANNVSLLNKSAHAQSMTSKIIDQIKTISKRDDVFELLANSLAPSIYGHLWIKKAVILLMLGGVEKNLKNGTHLRGDINMMMVGDPSVAKSQLLRAIMNIAPLAISTTGRGSSGVGLTAAVTSDQETGERRLEAGAMVLADRGVVCIDEFDKMNDQDRVAIHEVMEQQTVTIAKAGIHASLNARCSVVAAANPIYGSYDRSITPTKNIGLPDSLLSRFDLLFIVLDQMDPVIDRQISGHVLRMHRYMPTLDKGGAKEEKSMYEEENEDDNNLTVYVKYNRMLHGANKGKSFKRDTLTIKFLKKYIHYAKERIQPCLTDEASDHIATTYAELRNASANAKTGGGTLPITARTLETIIRLSTAHAKLKLRRQVLKSDVEVALQVLNFAIYHQELTEMEEREKEIEIEMERKRRAERNDGDDNNETGQTTTNVDGTGNVRSKKKKSNNDSSSATRTDERDVMAVDDPPSSEPNISTERFEAFSSALGKHRLLHHLEQMSVADINDAVNSVAAPPYSSTEIMSFLEIMQEKEKLMINRLTNTDADIVYFT